MKKLALLVIAGALALPSSALAGETSSSTSAAKSCKDQRAAIGATAFKDLYGTNKTKSNAFGKCVSKQTHAQDAAQKDAAGTAPAKCREEQAADPAAFAAKYGTNKKKTNAFGKCVSQTAKADAKQAVADHDQATIEAAKACKAERAADPAAFAAKYGTNKNKRNAYGKCVSQQAHAPQS